MPSFEYRGKSKTGEEAKGTIDARDVREAESMLHEQGYVVFGIRRRVTPASSSLNPFSLIARHVINPLFAGATSMQLSVFYLQLAAMIRAGIPIIQAMNVLSKQGDNPRLRDIALQSEAWLQDGGTLSESFSRFPWMFSDLQISILRACETSGDLEAGTTRIAHYLEWEYQLRQKLKKSTMYPKILIVCAIFIPNIKVLILDSPSVYFHQTLPIFLILLLGSVGLWMLYRWANQIPTMKVSMDSAKLAIPAIGKMLRMIALSKFYRSFSAMYSAGVALSTSLEYAADATGNDYLRLQLRRAVPRVQEGIPLVDCLQSTGVLPKMSLDMLHTGGLTGNTDEMMLKLADFMENEAEISIFQTMMILDILLFLCIAIYIGSIIVGFYSGYGAQVRAGAGQIGL